jgi:hypothetical protein
MSPPPNDNTDGQSGCPCGHATSDHQPFKASDGSEQAWKCLYCGCTRAYPARVSSTN